MKISKKFLPPISLLLISTLGVAYAATTLFTQTFPAVPSVTSFKSNCTTLTPFVSSVGPGSSGDTYVTCGGICSFPNCGGVAAFNVTLPAAGGQTLPMTPTFTLPAGYNRLDLFDSTGSIFGATLTSGSTISLARGAYLYHAFWSGAPATGLPTFSITWTPAFTQTFPAIPVTAASFVSNCPTLISGVSAVGVGSSGTVGFTCAGSRAFTAAFNVTVPAGQTFSMTPTFTLPAPYTSIAVYNFFGTSGVGLTSGTTVSLPPDGYYYVLHWSNAPATGLPTFSVAWT